MDKKTLEKLRYYENYLEKEITKYGSEAEGENWGGSSVLNAKARGLKIAVKKFYETFPELHTTGVSSQLEKEVKRK